MDRMKKWESDIPPRPTNFNRFLPEGFTLTDKWGDDWILTDGKFIVDGWYIKDQLDIPLSSE